MDARGGGGWEHGSVEHPVGRALLRVDAGVLSIAAGGNHRTSRRSGCGAADRGAEWAVHSHPKVHRIFSELWGTERLWVSFDNVGIRLPDREGYDGGDGFVHWDLTEAQLRGGPSAAMRVQGVLMLEDTPADGGTF